MVIQYLEYILHESWVIEQMQSDFQLWARREDSSSPGVHFTYIKEKGAQG